MEPDPPLPPLLWLVGLQVLCEGTTPDLRTLFHPILTRSAEVDARVDARIKAKPRAVEVPAKNGTSAEPVLVTPADDALDPSKVF